MQSENSTYWISIGYQGTGWESILCKMGVLGGRTHLRQNQSDHSQGTGAVERNEEVTEQSTAGQVLG